MHPFIAMIFICLSAAIFNLCEYRDVSLSCNKFSSEVCIRGPNRLQEKTEARRELHSENVFIENHAVNRKDGGDVTRKHCVVKTYFVSITSPHWLYSERYSFDHFERISWYGGYMFRVINAIDRGKHIDSIYVLQSGFSEISNLRSGTITRIGEGKSDLAPINYAVYDIKRARRHVKVGTALSTSDISSSYYCVVSGSNSFSRLNKRVFDVDNSQITYAGGKKTEKRAGPLSVRITRRNLGPPIPFTWPAIIGTALLLFGTWLTYRVVRWLIER